MRGFYLLFEGLLFIFYLPFKADFLNYFYFLLEGIGQHPILLKSWLINIINYKIYIILEISILLIIIFCLFIILNNRNC